MAQYSIGAHVDGRALDIRVNTDGNDGTVYEQNDMDLTREDVMSALLACARQLDTMRTVAEVASAWEGAALRAADDLGHEARRLAEAQRHMREAARGSACAAERKVKAQEAAAITATSARAVAEAAERLHAALERAEHAEGQLAMIDIAMHRVRRSPPSDWETRE